MPYGFSFKVPSRDYLRNSLENNTTEGSKGICEDIFKDFPKEFLMELPKGYSKEFFKDCCREFSQTFLRNSLLNWLRISLNSSLRKPPVILP